MKGVTRVTASLLAAAMTAGLGTTAVFADVTDYVADPAEETKDTSTHWIEVLDKDSHIIGTTDPEDEKVWAYSDADSKWTEQDRKDTTKPVDVNLVLSIGGTKTLTTAVNADSTATVKWGYQDTNNDGKIDKSDVTTDSQEPVTDVLGLDNGVLTAKKAGTVVVYAYTSDAVKKVDETKADSKTYLDEGKYVQVTVTVVDMKDTYIKAEFADKDNVYSSDNDETTIEGILNGTKDTTTEASKDNTAKHLYYHGTTLLNHKNEGETATVKTTTYASKESTTVVRDDSDENDGLKFYTTAPKFLSVAADGTVSVIGTAPKSGLGKVYAYYDSNNNGKYDTGEFRSNAIAVISHNGTAVYRVYNPNSGEHVYTIDESEKNDLVNVGWQYEGIGWYAPTESSTPVYRVYNPVAGEHVYTTSADEVKKLVAAGWNDEGEKFYSASNKYYAIFRQYNPNAFANNHNYTGNALERTFLVSLGWKDEGTKLYATELSHDTLESAAKYTEAESKVDVNNENAKLPSED